MSIFLVKNKDTGDLHLTTAKNVVDLAEQVDRCLLYGFSDVVYQDLGDTCIMVKLCEIQPDDFDNDWTEFTEDEIKLGMNPNMN